MYILKPSNFNLINHIEKTILIKLKILNNVLSQKQIYFYIALS